MGLGKERGGLEGMVRTTLVTNETRERVFREHRIPVVPEPENVYQNNIQIAEINGLNAAIAVMLFKKHFGFYIDDEPIYNSIILINKLTNYRQRLI